MRPFPVMWLATYHKCCELTARALTRALTRPPLWRRLGVTLWRFEHQETSRLSLQEAPRLERSASTDLSLRGVLIFSAVLFERPNLFPFFLSKGWAKSTG